MLRGKQQARVEEICTRDVQVAYPDETLGLALQRMSRGDFGRLPLVEHRNPHKLVSLLRRTDVIHAYDIALTRRATQRHQVHRENPDAITPERVNVSEVVVEAGSVSTGKRMKDIA